MDEGGKVWVKVERCGWRWKGVDEGGKVWMVKVERCG